MHFIIVLICFLFLYEPIYSFDNCNNNYSNTYCEKLFKLYEEAELKDEQRLYARQIISFAAINSWPFNTYQLETLQKAYNLHGCSIFPSLLEKNKFLYAKDSSPIQNVSCHQVTKPISAQNQNLKVVLNVFKDSLHFTTSVKKQITASFNKSITGFMDVEIATFFKDSVWYACISSYNAQVRNKSLFSFFLDGSYKCNIIPDNFNEKKFCQSEQGLFSLTCDVKYHDLDGGSYLVGIHLSKENDIKLLKNITIPVTQYNPLCAMNIVAIERIDPAIVWVDGRLLMQNLITEEIVDFGRSDFSSVSKISFSNNGRIVWIEGCERYKDLSRVLVQAWDLKEKKQKRCWASLIPFARNFTFSPNGVLGLGLVVSNSKNIVLVCDASNGSVIAQFKLGSQISDYVFKSNSEILINCGKEGWHLIDVKALQMVNWLAIGKSFKEAMVFLSSYKNLLFQEAQNFSKDQVFNLDDTN